MIFNSREEILTFVETTPSQGHTRNAFPLTDAQIRWNTQKKPHPLLPSDSTPSDLQYPHIHTLPSEMLITVIGNLLDNAFEAMNESFDYKEQKELIFGICSKPGAVLITVDDTGKGCNSKDLPFIFEKGYSTKGDGRGFGLYQVKAMVENFGGKITVESQEGIGSSFSVSFSQEG